MCGKDEVSDVMQVCKSVNQMSTKCKRFGAGGEEIRNRSYDTIGTNNLRVYFHV